MRAREDGVRDAGDDDDDPRIRILWVLESIETAVNVYLSCQWTLIPIGMNGVQWQGISTQEMNAALVAHRVPRSRWLHIQQQVGVMVGAARPIRNKASNKGKGKGNGGNGNG